MHSRCIKDSTRNYCTHYGQFRGGKVPQVEEDSALCLGLIESLLEGQNLFSGGMEPHSRFYKRNM